MKQYSHWLSKGVVSIAMGIIALYVPQYVFAAESCECFCGNQEEGAFSGGTADSQSQCARACGDVQQTYVGCYTDEALYPVNNNLCWTQDECSSYPIKSGQETYQGTWSGQNAHCSVQQVTGAAMGYCYGPLVPVTLNVPILGVTSVGSIGDYVNLVYRFAIPVVALFAVLMFTIAGFQYMTAGGDKTQVSKAKNRMTNILVGIVLLLSVFLIAYLIDPRLTWFNELRPPLVKKAVFINDLTTCEALYSYGYCIDGKCKDNGGSSTIQKTCGEKGEITGNDSIKATVINGPNVGDTCFYSGCSDKSESCIMNGDNSDGQCVSCDDVSDLNVVLGIAPSASVCATIAARAQANDTNKDHVYACYFDDDFSSLSGADAAGADECVQFYTSGKSYIDCAYMKDTAVRKEDACESYAYLYVSSFGATTPDLISQFFGMRDAGYVEDFKNQFKSLCEQDVCSVANAGRVKQGSCVFQDSSTLQDATDSLATLFGYSDLFDSYGCIGGANLEERTR